MTDIYRALQKKLDTMSNGYPATESGIEIEILKEIFTEKMAEIFIQMDQKPEKIEDIHQRLGGNLESLTQTIDAMSHAGVLRRDKKNGQNYYSAVPFVVGIFEHQINTMSQQLAKKIDQYFDEGFGKSIQAHGTPIMRTIPVNKEITVQWPVAPYDDAASIIDDQKTIALAPCICRITSEKADKGCDHSKETCLIFGTYAEYYVENNMGRFITREEAKQVLKRSEQEGVVIQPFNAQRAGGMCSCCGCCCGILKSIKLQPVPADAVRSNFFAVVDEDLCNGCEVCIDRCQVDAISINDDDIAQIDLQRCIGCGLCVTTCATEAMSMQKKDDDFQYVPPKTGMRTYIEISKARQAKGEI